MKTSQRSLVVASLVVLAIGMSGYCMDYQTRDGYRFRGHFYEHQLYGPPFVVSSVLITLDEAIVEPGSIPHVAVSGFYPRGNMTSNEAAIGGLLAPFLLLIGAGYVALGASRISTGGGAAMPASAMADRIPAVSLSTTNIATPMDASAIVVRMAIVIFPVLFVLDMPSLMLLRPGIKSRQRTFGI
jgi:hypothetical protein